MKSKKISEIIRQCCSKIPPANRLATVVILIAVFGSVNIYFVARAVFEIGRESRYQEFLKIEHIKQVELEKNKQVPSHSNQKEEENE